MSALLLLGVVVLILLNGFFVAAEFALVRTRRSKLEDLEKETPTKAVRVALRELDDLSEYLSACQFGITLTSLGIGFLGEPAIAKLLEPLLGNVISHGVAVALALAFAYIVTTAAHVTVGEQVPKLMAIAHAERTVLVVARPLHLFSRVFRPFILVLNATSNAILRLIRIRPESINEEGSGPDELKRLIAESYTGGTLDPGEAGMLTGVFHLHEQEARQVMTPIP